MPTPTTTDSTPRRTPLVLRALVAVALLAASFGAFSVATGPTAEAAPAWTSITAMTQTETIAGVSTTVTATLGADASNVAGSYGTDFYWETNATAGANGAWVRWSFDHDVTSLRLGVGAMEDTDPYMLTTDQGPVDLGAAIVDGGQVGGGWAGGIPIAGSTTGLLVCPTGGPQCGGWVEMSFPSGIEWFEISGAGVGIGANVADLQVNAGTAAQPVTFNGANLDMTQSPYTPTAATVPSGGGAISYSVASAGTTGCTVDPTTGVLTYTAVGTCRVTATAAATATYDSDSVTADFVISLIPQTVTYSGGSLTTLQTPYTPTAATSDGPGAITYAVTSAGTTGCTVDPTTGTLTYTASGTCQVTATAAATSAYAAGSTPASFVISRVPQTVTFTGASLEMPQSPSTLAAPATTTGTGAITYAVTSAGTTGCTVDPTTGTLTYTATGTCQVTATAAANDTYDTGAQAATFTIGLAAQTVAFTGASLTTLQTPFTLTTPATTTGDGAITYAATSAGTTGCTVDPATGTLTYTASGTCQVTASAAATSNYAAADQAATFTISAVPQTVAFTGAALTTLQSPYALPVPATTSGTGAITYAVTDAGATGCTVDPTTGELTYATAGTCQVTATAAANSTYDAATTTATYAISLAPSTVTWSEQGTQTATNGVWTPPSGAAAVGGGAITYSLASGPCTVDPTTGATTFRGSGTCVVRATSAATTQYASATADIAVEGAAAENTASTTPTSDADTTSSSDPTPIALAMTGAAGRFATIGALVLALGIVMTAITRRRGRPT